jgi:septal ring factor EnvC (AmiA/AmiB activator)
LPRPTPTTRPPHHWITALLIALLVTTAHSQPKPSDLDRLRGEIKQLRQRLDDVRAQARTAQQELEEVDLELGIRSRELAIAIDMQQRLDDERKGLEQQIASIGPRLDRQKHFLSKRLAALYRLGSLSYLRMFLAIDQQRDPLEAMSMLSYVVSRDARAVSRFQAERQQLSARYFDLADRRKRIEEMRRVVEDRRQAVAAAHEQKQRMLASLQSEETGSARRLAELEEKARRLEHLVDVLAKQRAGIAAATDIRSVQGALGWPVQGKVIEGFGRQRDPKFSTYTVSNGLKIGAAAGAPVHAVFQGTVLFSQWFKGYGNLIIVDHGNRVFSLYGNLKAPGVAVGDRVVAGQTIAEVGESEEADAGYLYFEIRQDNRPDDPRRWLR